MSRCRKINMFTVWRHDKVSTNCYTLWFYKMIVFVYHLAKTIIQLIAQPCLYQYYTPAKEKPSINKIKSKFERKTAKDKCCDHKN